MQKRLNTFLNLPAVRWAGVCAAHAVIFLSSGIIAFWLRYDFRLPSGRPHDLVYAFSVLIAFKSVVFQIAKLNRKGLRYASIFDISRLIAANLAASIASFIFLLATMPRAFPRSVYLNDLILSFLATMGLRLGARLTVEWMHSGRPSHPEKRTIIYGAGEAGMLLLREIRNNAKLNYRVVGFLDDAPHKQGMRIHGVPVLGGSCQVEACVARSKAELILIAIPSVCGIDMTRILEACHGAGVPCKTVPGLEEIIDGSGLAGQIREVAVEDLLGRTPIRLEDKRILESLAGKVVLVTGAAGSIGSELCRQIACFRPAAIVGFEIAESPLFEIDREMRQRFPATPFIPEIGSIQNRARLNEVFGHHRPAVVYHAAAYKHVPLMEQHVFEAIENNVFGTFNVAKAAKEYGAESFVMISSDKAVRPTNVMGATKRLAELLVMALQNGGTQFVAVRFGNVLGSNGSVIPIFKKQIATGGPVTVTHPEMRRFFMTISEACQLVLEASAVGEGGQICVLDMGQPVKIADLARNLILLSGLKPDKDIKIEFIGARPGEKMYEELSGLLEDTVPTRHERIRIFVGGDVPDADMQTWLDSLREVCRTRNMASLVVTLKEIVPDYNPSNHLLNRIFHSRAGAGSIRPFAKAS